MYCKRLVLLLCLLIFPSVAYAMNFEAAAGVWGQTPSGEVSYEGDLAEDTIDLVDDADMGPRANLFARFKLEPPMYLPNVYLMTTPMGFSGEGSKDVSFSFGDINVRADVDFKSRLRLDHYDIALYYHVPGLGPATADILNIEFGLDARFMNLGAEIRSEGYRESKNMTVIVPMGYLGVQIAPVEFFSIEGELRGVGFDGNEYIDYMARLKIKPFPSGKFPYPLGGAFVGAGYRAETIKVDVNDFGANVDVGGPFIEVGMQF